MCQKLAPQRAPGSERCWLYNDNFLAYKILLKHSGYSGVVLSIEDNLESIIYL